MVILTCRNADRLTRAADELGALGNTAFDAADPTASRGSSTTFEHRSTAPGSPPAGRATRAWRSPCTS